MATEVIIYPYKMASASAVALRDSLRAINVPAKLVRPDGAFVPRDRHLIINWGNSSAPNWDGKMANEPIAVSSAANKLTCLRQLQAGQNRMAYPSNLFHIPFTTSLEEAYGWLAEGSTVFSRTLLNSHSGGGIIINRPVVDFDDAFIVNAPLYTRYIKKFKEFRVHVFDGGVIDIQEKRRALDFERTDDQALLRSHANGWNFARENIEAPTQLHQLAIDAVHALGLDFGGVDIIYNQRLNTCYILEVNTAVGLEGTTLQIYRDAIVRKLQATQQP